MRPFILYILKTVDTIKDIAGIFFINEFGKQRFNYILTCVACPIPLQLNVGRKQTVISSSNDSTRQESDVSLNDNKFKIIIFRFRSCSIASEMHVGATNGVAMLGTADALIEALVLVATVAKCEIGDRRFSKLQALCFKS